MKNVADKFKLLADKSKNVADKFKKLADIFKPINFQAKEVTQLNNVIDFISIKQQKQNEQLAKVFSKANSLQNPEQIKKLVDEKSLAIQDHKLFLAFLAYLEEKQIDPASIFQAVLKLPKHQFEQQYHMNWRSVVQLCFTFLTILKDNEPLHYQKFISEMK